ADVHQHHDGAVQQARGVGHILPRAPGRAAVNGLEHGALVADVGRAGQPYAAGDLRDDVGGDVAVEIGQDDDVKLLGRVGHLGHADVDDPVLGFDVGVFLGHFPENFVEEAVGHLHDVVFRKAGDFLAPVLPRVL